MLLVTGAVVSLFSKGLNELLELRRKKKHQRLCMETFLSFFPTPFPYSIDQILNAFRISDLIFYPKADTFHTYMTEQATSNHNTQIDIHLNM